MRSLDVALSTIKPLATDEDTRDLHKGEQGNERTTEE